MNDAIRMLLAGTPVDKTSEAYRTYHAGLLLSARLKAASELLRHHPDRMIRDHLRTTRKDLEQRKERRAAAFGPHYTRMEPTISRETLMGLRKRHPDPRNQAYALIRSPIEGLDLADQETQNDICVSILSERAIA